MTTTAKDVRAAFERFCEAAQFSLAPDEHYILQEGSPSNGRAWRIFIMRDGSSAHFNARIGEYLGWTKDEAETKLHAWCNGIYLAKAHYEARSGADSGKVGAQ